MEKKGGTRTVEKKKNVSTSMFESEVRYVMREFEIEDVEDAIEETISQFAERGDATYDLSGVDMKTTITRLKGGESKEKDEDEGKSVSSATSLVLPTSMTSLAKTLKDPKERLGKRMRSLFYLRSEGGDIAIDAICYALKDHKNGSLLRHECAFVLGQMGAKRAMNVLESVLRDVNDDPMTRHEAAEAIGALGVAGSEQLIQEFCDDKIQEVADTCRLALDRLRWQFREREKRRDEETTMSLFNSVDPAPPLKGMETKELETIVQSGEESLFRRYGALFALRDRNDDECARIIANALDKDRTSALFRHEVAFVCGQIANDLCTDALRRALVNADENVIVRHECAEALGAIGTDDCVRLLKATQNDPSVPVAESALIALDVINYWAVDDDDEKNEKTGRITKAQAAALFAKPLRCACSESRTRK